jgi:Mn2+/Fe2+ NRAMP family transporter
LILSS